jgi:hypothetical protein
MKKVFFALGTVFAVLLVSSGVFLFLQYNSAKNQEVTPPDIAEYQAPQAPAGEMETPIADGGDKSAVGQPGDDYYSPDNTAESQSNDVVEDNSVGGVELAEAQAEYQRTLDDKERQVDAYRLLLFVICGILAFLALFSFILGIIYERPRHKEALPFEIDNPSGPGVFS